MSYRSLSALLVLGSLGQVSTASGVGLTCLCLLGQPPPPELGYSITAEDLDMERRASLQWFNKVLEDKTGKTVELSMLCVCFSFPGERSCRILDFSI